MWFLTITVIPLNNILIKLVSRINLSSCCVAVILKMTIQAADPASLFVTHE